MTPDMKKTLGIWCGLIGGSALAQGLYIPPELQGTWAASATHCKRAGPTTLTITDSAVLGDNIKGGIQAGWTSARRSIEVVFSANGAGPHQPSVRTFTLSSDGKTLYELKDNEVVASREKCGNSSK